MSDAKALPSTIPEAKRDPVNLADTAGLTDVAASPLDDITEKKLDQIEIIGEEEAAGFRPKHSEVSAGMRYLHCSRTIHQLVTDRNRAVGIYLAVASLLWTASGAMLNARPSAQLKLPIAIVQQACLPVTFGVLTVLAVFTAFLLIRTRIGLIYEVAKMNVLLGLPAGRVKRLGFLSIFFIMHLLISLAGGGSAVLLSFYILYTTGTSQTVALGWSLLVGALVASFLVILYIGTVLYITADRRLGDAAK
jgi:hypothetical protein